MRKLKLLKICALLLATVVIFTACGDPEEEAPGILPENGNGGGEDVTVDVPVDEEPNDEDLESTSGFVVSTRRENLPDSDFGGRTFTFLIEDPNEKVWTYTNMIVEELTGVVLDDAYFMRNAAVEELLNITLQQTFVGVANQVVFRNAVLAGDDSFDSFHVAYGAAANLAISNLALNLHELPYVDLTMPWWDQNSLRDLSIAGQHFLVAGDLSIGPNDNTWLIYFDKQHLMDMALDNPYQLVRDGLWTMDAMLSMMRTAQQIDPATGNNLIYGLATHGENIPALWIAAGETIMRKDADDIPFADVTSERFNAVFEMIREIMLDSATSPSNIEFISSSLRDGQTLFGTEILSFVRQYREHERDFGILPMPKFNVYQDSIHTYVALSAPLMIIPVSHPDVEFASIVLEALAAEGHRTIMPAYYLVAIEHQLTRDYESAEMLNIAFDTRLYDIGSVFNFGNLHSRLVAAGTNRGLGSPSTIYEAVSGAIERAITNAFDAFLAG